MAQWGNKKTAEEANRNVHRDTRPVYTTLDRKHHRIWGPNVIRSHSHEIEADVSVRQMHIRR